MIINYLNFIYKLESLDLVHYTQSSQFQEP